MAIAERAHTGGPVVENPYLEVIGAGPDVGVGITVGDTVAVTITPPAADADVHVKVIAGDRYLRVGASVQGAAATECVLPAPGHGPLFLHGVATTALDTVGGHDGCRIEISQQGVPAGVIMPRVHTPLALRLRLWRFSVSAEDPDTFEVTDDHGAYLPMTVYGQNLDVGRLITDVAAYWRPAGIVVTSADQPTGHLKIDRDGAVRVVTDAALKANAALRTELGKTVAERVMNVVLVPSYDRLGFTMGKWARDRFDEEPAFAKPASGFAGPVAVVAVNGGYEPDWSWTSRSTDISMFDGQAAPVAAADLVAFHYTNLASDIAHELGHMLGLGHTPDLPVDDPAAAGWFTQLMHPRLVVDGAKWQQPGWPRTMLGVVPRTDAVAALAVGVRAATGTLTIEELPKPIPAHTRLLLSNRRRTKWVEVTNDLPVSKRTAINVTQFDPGAPPFPMASSLQTMTEGARLLKGGLLPAVATTQARRHITEGLAF